MNVHSTRKVIIASVAASFIVVLTSLASGCADRKDEVASFSTPEEAVTALVTALEKNDVAAAARLLGAASTELLDSGDPVADKADRAQFVSSYREKHSIVDGPEGRKTLVLGPDDWPMPVPLVERDSRWIWDGAAGVDELIYRRVGRNELGAIDVMRGFVEAQVEYASVGRDGDPPGIYALKLVSDEGLHNGLYWPVAEDEPPSPAGPFVASAAGEGYRAGARRTPYHGYYYRMLYAQGPRANGGAREYFKDGLLTEGFALVAWPAEYGSSGVQTFIVNQDGVVFQKDLGEDTAALVESIQAFDPDNSWTAIAPQEPPAGIDAAAAETGPAA